MNTIKKLVGEVNGLEKQFLLDIARVTAELEPLPHKRDKFSLENAWVKAVSSQRKLANCLKDGLEQVEANNKNSGASRHLLRSARNKLKAVQSKLRGWEDCRSLVSAQLGAEHGEPATASDSLVLDQLINLFFDSMHKIANPTAHKQDADAKEHGCHPDIPYPMSAFSSMIGKAHRICLALQKRRPLRFLDIGSGGGTKVLAATICFDFCDGLEYEKNVVVTGQRFLEILSPERCKLMQGDALEFSRYGDYDVIYYYKPIVWNDKMAEMEERIFTQARPGTLLLNPFGLFSDDPGSKQVHEVSRHIYITGKSEDEATAIRHIAGHIGPMVPGSKPARLANPEYWTALLENSARSGYFL